MIVVLVTGLPPDEDDVVLVVLVGAVKNWDSHDVNGALGSELELYEIHPDVSPLELAMTLACQWNSPLPGLSRVSDARERKVVVASLPGDTNPLIAVTVFVNGVSDASTSTWS